MKEPQVTTFKEFYVIIVMPVHGSKNNSRSVKWSLSLSCPSVLPLQELLLTVILSGGRWVVGDISIYV